MTKETAEVFFADEGSALHVGDDEKVTSPGGAIHFDSDAPQEEDDDVRTAETDGEDGEPGDEESEGDDAESLSEEDLSAFDPEDAEQVGRYEAAFTLEDGSLDVDGSLSRHYWSNIEAGKEGMDEGVYAYLASKGISKGSVKQIEAMAQTQADAEKSNAKTGESHDHALFEAAGGPDELQKALAWGKAGGYSKEQQDRFNKLTKGKDLEAKLEAVEALMSRYKKANPPKRPTVPERDATKGGGSGKKANNALPFKDRHEMRTMRDSLRDNDKAGWALFRKRRAASTF